MGMEARVARTRNPAPAGPGYRFRKDGRRVLSRLEDKLHSQLKNACVMCSSRPQEPATEAGGVAGRVAGSQVASGRICKAGNSAVIGGGTGARPHIPEL